MTARVIFSRILREVRLKKGLSQEDLAFEAGLSMRSISLLEGNKQQPSITTIENLSKALGIRMVDFFMGLEIEHSQLTPKQSKATQPLRD